MLTVFNFFSVKPAQQLLNSQSHNLLKNGAFGVLPARFQASTTTLPEPGIITAYV